MEIWLSGVTRAPLVWKQLLNVGDLSRSCHRSRVTELDHKGTFVKHSAAKSLSRSHQAPADDSRTSLGAASARNSALLEDGHIISIICSSFCLTASSEGFVWFLSPDTSSGYTTTQLLVSQSSAVNHSSSSCCFHIKITD